MAFKSLTQTETKDTAFRTSTPLLPTQTNGSKTATETTTKPANDNQAGDDAEDVYNKKLCELNKSFFKHINGYMSRSEFYDFTQVCNEYIDYHKKIETEANSQTSSATNTVTSQSSHTSAKTSTTTSDKDSVTNSQTSGKNKIGQLIRLVKYGFAFFRHKTSLLPIEWFFLTIAGFFSNRFFFFRETASIQYKS